MVDMLSRRIKRQRELVDRLLVKHDMSANDLMQLTKSQLPDDDELVLCYNILMDCEYIESLLR